MKIENATAAVRQFKALARISTTEKTKEIPFDEYRGLQLYNALLRIEKEMNRIAVDECNGMSDERHARAEKRWAQLEDKVRALIAPDFHKYLHFNGDPRGYTLKLEAPARMTDKDNAKRYTDNLHGMHTDMGGYFILAPDF